MREEKILNSLKNSIEQAPIDILDKIKAEPRIKMLKHDDITRQNNRSYPFRKLMSYAVAAAVFVIMFFGWQYQTGIPDSRVYLDVNPSIEIVSNRQDKVIGLSADNQDGKRLIEDLMYKGKNIYQVTEEILDRMMNERYLSREREILLLSIYNKNQNKAEQQKQILDERIHEHLQAKELQPIVLLQKLDNTTTIEKYARMYGISVSKMTFIRNLIILNPELQPEDLAGLSIEELVRLSQSMEIDLEKIIESADIDRIRTPLPEPDPEESPDITSPNQEVDNGDDDHDDDDDDNDDHDDDDYDFISSEKARSIALSVADGTITDFEFDDDDLEYVVEIEVEDLEYEITIDARTGEIIEIEIDD